MRGRTFYGLAWISSFLIGGQFSHSDAQVCMPSPVGAVSWWAGDVNADDIQDGNNGVLQNGATLAPGIVGQAFNLDGVNDLVRVPSVANLEVQQFSVEAWVLAQTTGFRNDQLGGIIATKDIGDTFSAPFTSWGLTGPGNTGRFNAFVGLTDGSHPQVTSTNIFEFNRFHFVAMTWDGSELKLYVNGQLEGALVVGFKTVSYSGEAITIGDHNLAPAHRSFDGLIDEVEFYNRALSNSEIEAIFSAGSAGKCKLCVQPPTDLVSWWPGDVNADDIQDGNNGVLENGATLAPGMVGQAFNLDGVNDLVRVSSVANLEVQQFSVDAWVLARTTGFRNDQTGGIIATKDIGDTSPAPFTSWTLTGPGNTGRFNAFVGLTDGSHPQVTSTNIFEFNRFHFVAMTWDGGELKLYVNGQLEGALVVGSKTVSYSGEAITIGDHNLAPAHRSFDGLIDEVEFYNRALSNSEIEAIFSSGSTGKCRPDGDNDGDRVPDSLDCAPINPDAWAVPGAIQDLMLTDAGGTTMLRWEAPLTGGAAGALLYDTLLSTVASNFNSALTTTCRETDDGPNANSTDDNVPAEGSAFFYLIRAENVCGLGSLGVTSAGEPRVGRSCP